MDVKLVLGEGVNAPFYATPGAAGFDIAANEDVFIKDGERAIVGTGLFFEIPEGYELQIRPRSGNAAKYGVTVLNTPGTIDSDYRGEVKVILYNTPGNGEFAVRRGDRIAQGVLAQVEQASFKLFTTLSETTRGAGGFGHTGK
jgi:dUTP pyrophosphatase